MLKLYWYVYGVFRWGSTIVAPVLRLVKVPKVFRKFTLWFRGWPKGSGVPVETNGSPKKEYPDVVAVGTLGSLMPMLAVAANGACPLNWKLSSAFNTS